MQLEIILLCLNIVLLGIWATKETIALRNFLLVFGLILTIWYTINLYKNGILKIRINSWKIVPLAMIILAFSWVLIHYFFFSINQDSQLQELKSTWLRALFAVIVGFGCGIVISRNPNYSLLLMLGIFFSFLVLFSQYIPQVIVQQKLLVPNYPSYLFHLKINTVIVGALLLAGVGGSLLDLLFFYKNYFNWIKFVYIIYFIFINLIILWSFVYIVDSRNGIGLTILLYSFWIICLPLLLKIQNKFSIQTKIRFFLATFTLLILISFSLVVQMKLNSGWKSIFYDFIIAVQIDKYEHWQNFQRPYPLNSSGQTVNASNYERISLATAGASGILQYPVGVGLLANPFSHHPSERGNMLKMDNVSTHSGWIELGLAFGIPMLIMIFVAFLVTLIIILRNDSELKMFTVSLVVIIIFLYAVGEAAIDHGLEILFYFLALLSSIPFLELNNVNKR